MRPYRQRAFPRSDKTPPTTFMAESSGTGPTLARVHTDIMAKKMLIDATHAEETRVVVVDGNKVEEFDFESENKRQLAGNIYLAKITRVEPSLQAAFVDYGGNRHGFLAFSEIHPDYYQIPVADREALLEEERVYAESLKERDEDEESPKPRARRSRSRKKTTDDQAGADATAVESAESSNVSSDATPDTEISGMETIDLVDDAGGDVDEGLSPMELVAETPVEEPADDAATSGDVVEEVAAEAPVVVAEVSDAPVEDADEASEVAANHPEETVSEAGNDTDAGNDVDKDAGPKTIAANTEGEDAVVSKDPETGDESETKASTPEADVAEAPVEAPTAEDTPVVETPVQDAPVGADAQETAPVEAAVSEDAAPSDAPANADAETVQTEDSGAADGQTDAQASDALEGGDTEKTEKPTSRRRPRRRSSKRSDGDDSRSNAADKDDSIESVANDDDIEDIRPPRKPRARRYKIQEVVKVRQVMLVQVVKEERGNKGAALTTYLSLAGRYCVLMPNTARGGGISRKITNAVDRKKLKEIATEIDVPSGAGLIVRTAGAKRTKLEIKRDYEYLQRMWEQIRELTLKSIAPAKIYEEGDLIKRSIRDLYSREIDEVLVEGERGYRIAKDFMKMIMPSHAKNVKRYQESLPLLARFQVESYLSGMFNPTVQLKSGGYIVIGVTEALVAIDVNSGRATKESSIEETALKTNLEAAEEAARQMKLRDLAGLIVIDFIDMDERKNNTAVEKRMKDSLKTDRARIQVGRISGFGLLEMSRQRLRPGMIEATTQPCPSCHGTGLIRSDDNLALMILRQIEEEGTRGRSREVLVKAPVDISNYLMNHKREHVAQIEARFGMSVRVEADPHLVSPDFSLEKFKSATRVVKVTAPEVVSGDASFMDDIDDAEVIEVEAEDVSEAATSADAAVTTDGEKAPKKRRRRRRRRKSNGEYYYVDGPENNVAAGDEAVADTAETSETNADKSPDQTADEGDDQPKKRTRTRSRSSRSRSKKIVDVASADAAPATVDAQVSSEAESVSTPEVAVETAPVVEAVADAPVEVAKAAAVEAPEAVVEAPVVEVEAPVAEAVVEAVAEAAPIVEAPVAEPKPTSPPKPKRLGWWSRG